MNPDQLLIQAAYTDAIKKLYATMFDSYVQSDQPSQQQQADKAFSTGVVLARKSRDRAIALLA